jgi:pyridinium-3,5-bisthiocarboxylic acid mononucleotide nickel chelatase
VRLLALDPVGGIAGDMLLGALLDLGAAREALDEALAALAQAEPGLRGVRVVAEPVDVNGIRALHVAVRPPEAPAHHRPWKSIRDLLARAPLPARAKEMAIGAFTRLAEAEGHVHGVAAEQVDFHEVGAIDSIVDVVGSSALLAQLAPERIVSLPPPAGSGMVRAAHGPIPLPAPAVVELLRGRTIRHSGPGERTTPTGAAAIAAWTREAASLPDLSVHAIGYGAGTKRWEDAPNVLRAILGSAPATGESVLLIEANLDDLTPQLLASALEAALEAGALDAWIAPVTMKKGRPGHVLSVLAADVARAGVEEAVFRETSTLGVRTTRVDRTVLERESVEVQTPYGSVRVKIGRRGGAMVNASPEFDDCRARAAEKRVPVKEVVAAAIAAFRFAR